MPDQVSHVQTITDNLNQAGYQTTSTDVIPTTSHTPVEKSEDLRQAGAEIVGDTDLETSLRDLEYIKEADLKHGDKTRSTESKNPLKMLLGKLWRKKTNSEEVVEK